MDEALDAVGLLPRVPLPMTLPLLPDLPTAETVSAASGPMIVSASVQRRASVLC